MRIEPKIILQSTDRANPECMVLAFRAIGNPTVSAIDYAPFRAIQAGSFTLFEAERAVRLIHVYADALAANTDRPPFHSDELNRDWKEGVKKNAKMARQLADTFLTDLRAALKAHGEMPIPTETPGEQLAREHAAIGHHPRFTENNWRDDIMAGMTRLGYWDWAYEQQEKYRG